MAKARLRSVARWALVAATLAVAAPWASAETLTIGVVDYHNASLDFLKNNIIPAFEQQHPGVQVVVREGHWNKGEWLQKITAWYAAGELPDAFQIGAEFLGQLAPFGILQPLDPFTKGWSGLGNFPAVEIQDGTYKGRLYDIPYRLDQRSLVYRKDLFSKAGLDPQSAPATWDQLAADAQKLTIKDDTGTYTQAGFRVTADRQKYALFLFEAGGHFLSSDMRTVTIGDPPAIAAAQFMSDLVNKYGVAPLKGVHGVTAAKKPSAIDFAGAGPMNNATFGKEIGVALPPKGPATRSGAIFINKWVMGSQSKDPKLAWDWIAFVSQPENMAKIAAAAHQVPPSPLMLHYAPWADDPRWQTWFEAASVTTPFRGQIPMLGVLMNGNANQQKDHLPPVLAAILANKVSIPGALATLAKQSQTELDDFWSKMGSGK